MLCILVISAFYSCKAQYGCPSNGKNVGAERILSGEKLPKAPKIQSIIHVPCYSVNQLNPNTMSLTLRTDFGCTEAVIDDDCGLKRFYEVANILSDDLDVNFNHKTMILIR